MYSVEAEDYGIKLTVSGVIYLDEAKEWLREYREKLVEMMARNKPFGHMVDLRGFEPSTPEVQEVTKIAMREFKRAGGKRSAVILDSAIVVMQIKRLAKETGIYDWERYIDAKKFSNPEDRAYAWIVGGVNPTSYVLVGSAV